MPPQRIQWAVRRFGGLNTSSPPESLEPGAATSGHNYRIGHVGPTGFRALAPGFGRKRIWVPNSMAEKLFGDDTTPVTLMGTLTSGDAAISNLTFTNGTIDDLSVGMEIKGTGIPAGARILSIEASDSLTMDQNATASGAQTLYLYTRSDKIIFYTAPAKDFSPNLTGYVYIGVDYGNKGRIARMFYQDDRTGGKYRRSEEHLPLRALIPHTIWTHGDVQGYRIFDEVSGVMELEQPAWNGTFPTPAARSWYLPGGTVWLGEYSSYGGAEAATAGASITKDSTTVTGLTPSATLKEGMLVVGDGIPSGTTIAEVTDGTTIELTYAATETGDTSLTFYEADYKLETSIGGLIVQNAPASVDNVEVHVNSLISIPTESWHDRNGGSFGGVTTQGKTGVVIVRNAGSAFEEDAGDIIYLELYVSWAPDAIWKNLASHFSFDGFVSRSATGRITAGSDIITELSVNPYTFLKAGDKVFGGLAESPFSGTPVIDSIVSETEIKLNQVASFGVDSTTVMYCADSKTKTESGIDWTPVRYNLMNMEEGEERQIPFSVLGRWAKKNFTGDNTKKFSVYVKATRGAVIKGCPIEMRM